LKRRHNPPAGKATRPAHLAPPALTPGEQLQQALAHHRAGELPQAEALYRQILAAQPDHPDALYLLGAIACQTGRNPLAVELLDRAIALNPQHPEACSARGNALFSLQRNQAALASYDHALRINPQHAEAWNNRGSALHALLEYSAALESYDRALALKPDYAEAQTNRGNTLLAIQWYQAVLASYEQAVRALPESERERQSRACESLLHTIARIAKIDDKAGRRAELDALPAEVQTHPAVCTLRAANFEKTESSGRDLVFFCGPISEIWSPATAATTGIGGSEEAVIWLSALLLARGWRVTVYASCGLQQQDHGGVAWKPYWMWNPRDKQDITVLWRHPQIVTSGINSGKLILDLHDVVPEKEFTPERLRQIDTIFVKSRFHRSLYPNVPDDKFVIVPNGIDAALFEDTGARDPLLLIHTSSPDRGLEAFLDCFAEIRKQVPDAKAQWAYGWAGFDATYSLDPRKMAWKATQQQRMLELGVAERGRLSHSEIAALYHRAAIFAYPSEMAEIDCISLSKAMAAGAIPITTDFAAMGEKAGHGGTFLHSQKTKDDWLLPGQFHFDMTDPALQARFVEAAVALLTHPPSEQDRAPMRDWARRTFDWKHIADTWHQALAAQPAAQPTPAPDAPPASLDQQFQQALAHHQAGRLTEAEALYRQILQANPEHLDALYLLGVIATQVGQFAMALDLADQAIRLRPEVAEPHANRGNALNGLGRHDAALESFDTALRLKPDFADAWSNRGNALNGLKQFNAALESFARALELRPDLADAWSNRGISLYELRQYQAARESFDQAIQFRPHFADAHNNRGNALHRLRQYQAALECFDQAIRLRPGFAAAYSNRGNTLNELQQPQAALADLDRAIALQPDFAEAWSTRGNVLYGLQQYDAALESCDRAISLNPQSAEGHCFRGNALFGLRQLTAALESFDYALQLQPDFVEAHGNRGSILYELQRYPEALESFNHALQLDPNYAEGYSNRGTLLHELQQYPAALENFNHTLRLGAKTKYLAGMRLHMRRFLCDWDGIEAECRDLAARAERSEAAAHPFVFLATSDSPALQHKAAAIYARDKTPPHAAPAVLPRHPPHDRIRIGYFSADFHNHATTYLMAELLEQHDRSRFEIFGFSFGPNIADEMRARVSAAMDRFHDVRELSDRAIAELSRSLELDIAVDLKGFTKDSRPGIFAHRAAPLQVSYLGYPGTMGAAYMDYLIADPTLIPESAQPHYSESILYLPDSYQANDTRRPISSAPTTRAAEGLPEHAFVFCCFNVNWKIAPATFDLWTRILAEVEGSVLWLLEDNPWVAANLRKEAARRGIAPERLIFAPRRPLADHLARHRLADLFLDTLPYNAHTTASDALWAGLPMLTCMGETFASRVGASLLRAIDLPELITATADDYASLAIALACNPARLRALREKLAHNRLATPLFDTPRFTRHLEAAYAAIHARRQAGLPPAHIHIAESANI
jgi:predicted O-linked N-acetylglucosamine transferase (SPINDLY family)